MGNCESRSRDNMNLYDKWGDTKLTNAARDGKLAKCEDLIKNGSDVDLGNTRWNLTPLHLASIFGHYQVVKLLINENADMNICDIEGLTALHRAALRGHKDVVRLLCEIGKVNVRDENGKTALYYAASEGKYDVVRTLCEHKADAGASDKNGHSTLEHPCIDGDLEVVKLLLSKGADPNVCLPNGKTLVTLAKEGGHDDIVNILCKHGANINDDVDASGYKSLDKPCIEEKKEVVEWLYKEESVVSYENQFTCTEHLLCMSFSEGCRFVDLRI